MKFSALSRTGFAVALSAVLASMVAPAQAETVDSIFAKVSPSVRDRMFFRLNYIQANVKTTAGDAYDVTGPVVRSGELRQMGVGGSYNYSRNGVLVGANSGIRRAYYNPASNATLLTSAAYIFENALVADANAGCESERAGLGTPCGIRAKGQATVGTPALSAGYYLDDEFEWVLEAYVLAAPLKVDVYGDGHNHLNGQNIMKLKLLPPTAVLGRYFGEKNDAIRPFVGFGGSYAMFFDVRATDFLNSYQGGGNAGDTTINIKNVMGFGPFLGVKAELFDGWHFSLNVGKLRYKTEATITTRNTTITSDSLVLQDYGVNAQNANSAGAGVLATNADGTNGVTNLMCDLANAKYGSTTCNHGTFVRKQSTVLDNTMFMLGVGHSF
jgi:outer membrane protein